MKNALLVESRIIINLLLNQSRFIKNLTALLIDIICCIFSVWFSYYLRLGDFVSLGQRGSNALIYSIIISLPIFIFFKLYKEIFRYTGLYTLILISKAIAIYGLIFSSIVLFIGIDGVPRTIGLIQPLLFWIFICSWRIISKYLIRKFTLNKRLDLNVSNALVYGAGKAGRQLVRAMQESSEIYIKGFIDDDPSRQGCFIDGNEIYSSKDLSSLIKEKKINLVLLALPSVSRIERSKIISNLLRYKISIRTIPGIADLANGKSQITNFLDLNIDELIGRVEVEPYKELMKKNIFQKTILVTGSGGSIGSELCRQIIKEEPKRILLLEISEYALYLINNELEKINSKKVELIPLIGSVQDGERIREILSIWNPDTIFHAAAYKHVPIVEHNIIEGLKNNLFGTYEIAKSALEYKVSNFVFISTDKAVRPTNFMGATKRLAELSLQALNDNELTNNRERKTKFSIVRFGNVLESSGSVIPKFREQISNGGPITLTHPEITRYFMTIPEAAQLVIQAGAMAKGGDVFVLDMGEPIRIYDLAKRMIQLSGKSIKNNNCLDGDIEIEITGLRPGEKLYEELLLSKSPIKTKHPKIFRSKEPFIEYKKLKTEIESLNNLIIKNDLEGIIKNLKRLVANYAPSSNIIDHTYINKKNK